MKRRVFKALRGTVLPRLAPEERSKEPKMSLKEELHGPSYKVIQHGPEGSVQVVWDGVPP